MAKAVAVVEEQSAGIERLKEQPERLRVFLGDVRSEMRKVISPSREEVQSTTVIVLIAVFVFAAYFEIVDFIASRTLDKMLVYLTRH
jgi:preprotein translocase subunit SecE